MTRRLSKFLNSRYYVSIAVLLYVVLSLTTAAHAAPQKTTYSTVDLLAEQASLPANGGSITVGFYLVPDPTWHAYWTNPGDAGKEPEIRWELPEGFEASELVFPAPHVLPFSDLNTYGFEEPILLLANVTVPDGLNVGDSIELDGTASWVVCDDKVCVPERANLSLSLPVDDGVVNAETSAAFAEARDKLPEAVEWPAFFEVVGNNVNIEIAAGDSRPLSDAYLFVASKQLVQYGRQEFAYTPRGVAFSMDAGTLAGREISTPAVLSFMTPDGFARNVLLRLDKADGPLAAAFASAGVSGGIATDTSFGMAVLYAFLGGLILNLMPCVFPILSMKALSFVNMSQQHRRVARESGVLYTLGVLAAFAAIGAAILGFRAAGNAVYWGFQFQNGPVNILVAMLLVAIGLNLLGVFEIGTRIMGVGQSLTAGGERKSAFFTGLLAVVVATPCGAPFMATAIGFAFTQSPPTLIAVFLALGFGLAFPYFALAFVPNVGKLFPKPGPWMATFKHFLAFPMFLAALYFFWVGGRVLGVTSMFAGLVAALALSFALWAFGKGALSTRKARWYTTAVVGLVATGFAFVQINANKIVLDESGQVVAGNLGGLELEHFDPDVVTQYIADGQPVFVYFTADWCISCKANEKVALSSDAVADAFHSKGIRVVEGDWTTEDPVITEWLARYGRVGVPLYLYYPAGSSLDSVTILPQILLPDTVVNAIDQADADAGTRYTSAEDSAEEAAGDEAAEAEPFVLPDAEPDWAPVQAYIDLDAVWHELDREIRRSDATDEEKARRAEEERGEHPDILAAQAAATAIVELGGVHDKTLEAAEFLIQHTVGVPGQYEAMTLGGRTLIKHHPNHEQWRQILVHLDFYTEPGASEEIESLFALLSEHATDPVAAASAKYYLASRLMRQANAVETPAADRTGYRDAAIAMATGFSRGVEGAELVKRRRFTDDGEPIPLQTMAEAEADILYNLNFMTVGNKIPNVTALNLLGQEERVSDYEGEVVLIDFWATWCGPCIASLPTLREMTHDLPTDDFEILSISVDESVDTVTDFQESRPMPWANWHIGPKSDVLKTWQVRGYPTYILVDQKGMIVARQHDMNEDFRALIKDTVCSASDTQVSC